MLGRLKSFCLQFCSYERCHRRRRSSHVQCDQIELFISLWATFQSLQQQFFAQIAHIFRQFL